MVRARKNPRARRRCCRVQSRWTSWAWPWTRWKPAARCWRASAATTCTSFRIRSSPTWRANADWGRELGYDAQALDRVNRLAVELIRAALAAADVPERRISGCIGPRGDGYVAARTVADAATEYHVTQIRTLADAIRAVDDGAPADFYGLNCAHPTHVLAALDGGSWQQRLTFFRPNASTLSPAELDVMEELDAGDVPVLVGSTRKVLAGLSAVAVLGGCCGTDSRHVAVLWRNGSS